MTWTDMIPDGHDDGHATPATGTSRVWGGRITDAESLAQSVWRSPSGADGVAQTA